ncbi:DUF4426 domain-containing protein [Saccharobesus litoralis]|uniref:DUF4426 domain-containing protein n=2 Tax=Saccharobesus litoralis TaxID=2172099 RepID=A0A2S0VXT3_9ALTE|nr:DUF4426 domain-containing protein [Saccharobesus litoralis]
MKFFIKCCLCFSLFFSGFSFAEQMKKLGKYDVHYIAFPSTFVQPQTAKALGLKRRNNMALVNISVLDSQSKKGQKVTVTGFAKNLIGHHKELTFIEVDEGNAIYYMAQVKHSNEETLRFTIYVDDGVSKQELKFQNKMYVDGN